MRWPQVHCLPCLFSSSCPYFHNGSKQARWVPITLYACCYKDYSTLWCSVVVTLACVMCLYLN